MTRALSEQAVVHDSIFLQRKLPYLVTLAVSQGLKPRKIPTFSSELPVPTCWSKGSLFFLASR